MAERSYLARIAQRAVHASSTIAPPRRVGRALPVAIPDEPLASPPPPSSPRAEMSRSDDGEAWSSPPAEPRTPHQRAAIATEDRVAPVESSRPTLAAEPRATEPERAPGPPSARRPADFSFTAPPRQPARTIESAATGDRPRSVTLPRPSPRTVLDDPVLAVLREAVRWTSSEDQSPPGAPATRATGRAAGRAIESRAVPAPLPVEPATPRATARLADRPQAPATPPIEAPVSRPLAQPRVIVQHERISAAPLPAARTSAPPDRFTSIHIGSVDVEIVQPAPAAAPAKPAAAPGPHASTRSAPLARGFTSSIGIRQS